MDKMSDNRRAQLLNFRVITWVLLGALFVASCGTLPSVATDPGYCCRPGTDAIATYRVEFEDTPGFLKPMLRDETYLALAYKGLEYTEGNAHAILHISFVNTPLRVDEGQDGMWGSIAPGGDARFIAEVTFELKDAVNGELIWSGKMGRLHNVTEGSYMHEARARLAMRKAIERLLADYPVIRE